MSEWFSADKRPARPGVYRVRIPDLNRQTWARWTGGHWCCWALSPETAKRCEWPGVRSYEWRID